MAKKTATKKSVAKKGKATKPPLKSQEEVIELRERIRGHVENLELGLKSLKKDIAAFRHDPHIGHNFFLGVLPPTTRKK